MTSKAILLLAITAVALPLNAQEMRFSKQMKDGDRLELQNINGDISVVQGTGRTAEILVTKKVKSGNGDLVKAIMEEGSGFVRICTIYLNRDPNRTTCKGKNSNDTRRDGERFEVVTNYQVTSPSGVRLEVESVNGQLMIRGIDTPASAVTVNGNIDFEGVGVGALHTVNGNIRATLTSPRLQGTSKINTVNGEIHLSVPSGLDADIKGDMVNGQMKSDFPMEIRGKWGPKRFSGQIGGGGTLISITTVNGNIFLSKI